MLHRKNKCECFIIYSIHDDVYESSYKVTGQ